MDFSPLFRSRKTVFELLEDRGYNEISAKPMTQEEFLAWAENLGTIEKVKKQMQMTADGPLGRILVRWPCSPKLSSPECTSLMACLKDAGIHNALVIIDDSVTPHVKNTLRLARRKDQIIEVFTLEEMQFNVSKHCLVPKHIICSKEEKKKIRKAYGKDLPGIKASDPQMKYLGAKKGQLIKIFRDSSVLEGEKAVSYREVS